MQAEEVSLQRLVSNMKPRDSSHSCSGRPPQTFQRTMANDSLAEINLREINLGVAGAGYR